MTKLTFEVVNKLFKENNCELLSTEYINSKTKLQFKCSCGSVSEKSLTSLKKCFKCVKCGYKQMAENNKEKYKTGERKVTLTAAINKKKTKFEDIVKLFKDAGCELLSTDYKSCRTKLKYKCSCGNESEIQLDRFKAGGRCINCASDRHKQICLDKYGVDNYSKTEECKNKVRNTNLKKFSVDSYSKTEEYKLRVKDTNIERYGVQSYAQTDEFKQRCLMKDGMYRVQTEEFKAKSKQTLVNKYGVEHYSKTEEFSYLMKFLHKNKNDFTNTEKCKQTCLQRYGVEYALQSMQVQEKRIKTLLQIYGYDNISKVQSIKDKKIRTFLTIYGYDHPVKSQIIQNKIKETNLDRYGVEHYLISEKYKRWSLDRYGVEYPIQCQEIQNKIKETNLDRYGVEHYLISEKYKRWSLDRYGVEYPIQSTEVFMKHMKSNKKYHNYIFPSNSIARVQGYESYALNILLKTNTELNIITNQFNMPIIWYELNGKYKRYYPDIYLKNENKIIEVKSQYTLYRDIYKNMLKKKASELSGIKFEFWVFKNNGRLWYKL